MAEITDDQKRKWEERNRVLGQDDNITRLEEAGEIDTSNDRAEEILSTVRGKDIG